MPGALDGVRVADFSRVLAGPYASMVLADLGADVIKVESPGSGDDTRAWQPPLAADGQSTYFHSVNRNKSSIMIDLKSEEGRLQARNLVADSDVLIENFMPGTMARFGLSFAQLQPHHSGLIYCSITGFGPGKGASLPGYDLLVQAMGGLMSITGTQPGDPTKTGVAVVDVLTGLHAAVGILAALHHRDATGEGQLLEVTLLGSLLASLVNQASAFVLAGHEPTILGNAHPSIAPYEVFDAQDRPMVIAVGNDRQFQSLMRAIGLSEHLTDTRFQTNSARVMHRQALVELISDALGGSTADVWQRIFHEAGVPSGPINSIPQAFALAETLGLEPIAQIREENEGTPTVASPLHLSKTPVQYRYAPPRYPGSPTESSSHDSQ
jgi:crotonobetainyl-CoA:carnitine CoA-transferase CaiB-like acyl-CoA transferase